MEGKLKTKDLKNKVLSAIIECERRKDASDVDDVKLINMGKAQAYQKVYDAICNKPSGLECDI